ncbi:MAG: PBP1A family penicillin-binding protein [Myxococcales bacterium]|nr:PBP1A family penicillin-binding protein [Myxococcales bacterium]
MRKNYGVELSKRRRRSFRAWAAAVLAIATIPLLLLALALLQSDVESRFGEAFRRLPSRVYSRPLILRPGMSPERAGLREHLERAGYRPAAGPAVGPREFAAGEWEWVIRDQSDGAATLRLDRRGRIESIRDARRRFLAALEVEPAPIGAFYDASAKDREPVRLAEVPPHLVEAILAMEDQHFFQHRGLDLKRIGGAFLANLRAQRVVQGGSTLTQQLVKNVYLTHERSLGRKLREALIAVMLERRHSKEEILEAYLNEVYLGQSGSVGIHGVGRAARHYFARSVGEIDLAQSALLVGILPGPSLYSPFRNPEDARERRDFVLGQLLAQDRIAEPEYRAAVAAPLALGPRPVSERSAAYFVDFLRQGLEARYTAESLESDGFAIYTTLDARLQRLAERALRRGLERLEASRPELVRPESPLEGAVVALDPHSGDILALVGGRDYGRSQFDRASEARRQPGSVFKPVVALAALARRDGEGATFTLATVLVDEPLLVPGVDAEGEERNWEPENHDLSFRGPVTLREAIEDSLNVPMARLGQQLGPARIAATARRLGIESRLAVVPSLALGSSEVTPLEMTRAYGVLAAGGVKTSPRALLRVVERSGTLREETLVERDVVFDPAEAWLVTSALVGVIERGTGRGLRGWGYRGEVAGKTGTTNDYRDAWFIGYTPDLVAGVWVGFDDGESIGLTGAGAALPIFAEFLTAAVGTAGRSAFGLPPGIERVSVVAKAGHPAGLRCNGAPEVFLEGTGPEQYCNRFRFFAGRPDRVQVAAGPVNPSDRPGEPRGLGRIVWRVWKALRGESLLSE